MEPVVIILDLPAAQRDAIERCDAEIRDLRELDARYEQAQEWYRRERMGIVLKLSTLRRRKAQLIADSAS